MEDQCNFHHKAPKMEFPRFDETDPRGWITKCKRYFQFYPMIKERKVSFSSMHLEGRADHWFQANYENIDGVYWREFAKVVSERFSDQEYENIIGEFNKLQQTTTVSAYPDKFEQLRPIVLSKQRELTEVYFVASFISGLKEEIMFNVQMLQPSTLEATSLARLQISSLKVIAKKNRVVPKPYNFSSYTAPYPTKTSNPTQNLLTSETTNPKAS